MEPATLAARKAARAEAAKASAARWEQARWDAQIEREAKRITEDFSELLAYRDLWEIDPTSPTAIADLHRVHAAARKLCMRLLPWQDCPVYRIIRHAFPEGATLEDIGDAYGLTRERVRQIEHAGLTQARAAKGLTPWADHFTSQPDTEIL